jgi:hypothetical protein
MIMSKFKVGDKVKCLKNRDYVGSLTLGKIYTVVQVSPAFTWVIDDLGHKFGYYDDRFELAGSEKEPEVQQPETFEYNKKIYRRATSEDSGKQGIMCDSDIADAEVRITHPYVSKGIMKYKGDGALPWRKTTTNSDWRFGYIEVEQPPKYRPIGPADLEPAKTPETLEFERRVEYSGLLNNYLNTKDSFERASTAFNEACQAIRDNVKDGEKFVYTRYGEGYIVQRDAAGFTVDKIDLI